MGIFAVLTLLPGLVRAEQPISEPGAAPCTPPAASSLTVPLRPQHASMWCWAASGQMLMEYLGKSISQCAQANSQFNRNDCCSSPTPNECNFGGWPQLQKYGVSFKTTSDNALPWNTVKDQLAPKVAAKECASAPFAFTWHWLDGGGHMMVATGYKTVNGQNYLLVNNPLEVDKGSLQIVLYDEYVAGDDHTHWNDYYDIK